MDIDPESYPGLGVSAAVVVHKLLSSDRAQMGVVEGSVKVSHSESTHCVNQVSHLTELSH